MQSSSNKNEDAKKCQNGSANIGVEAKSAALGSSMENKQPNMQGVSEEDIQVISKSSVDDFIRYGGQGRVRSIKEKIKNEDGTYSDGPHRLIGKPMDAVEVEFYSNANPDIGLLKGFIPEFRGKCGEVEFYLEHVAKGFKNGEWELIDIKLRGFFKFHEQVRNAEKYRIKDSTWLGRAWFVFVTMIKLLCHMLFKDVVTGRRWRGYAVTGSNNAECEKDPGGRKSCIESELVRGMFSKRILRSFIRTNIERCINRCKDSRGKREVVDKFFGFLIEKLGKLGEALGRCTHIMPTDSSIMLVVKYNKDDTQNSNANGETKEQASTTTEPPELDVRLFDFGRAVVVKETNDGGIPNPEYKDWKDYMKKGRDETIESIGCVRRDLVTIKEELTKEFALDEPAQPVVEPHSPIPVERPREPIL